MKATEFGVGLLARLISATVLFCLAAFCVFGFLASFEPGNGLAWKAAYGAIGCGCLTGALYLLFEREKTNSGAPVVRMTKYTLLGSALFVLSVLIFWLYVKLR